MRHCTDKPLCVPSLKGSPRARYEHVLRNQCRRETVRSTVGRAPFSRIFDLCDNILFQLFQTSILNIYIYIYINCFDFETNHSYIFLRFEVIEQQYRLTDGDSKFLGVRNVDNAVWLATRNCKFRLIASGAMWRSGKRNELAKNTVRVSYVTLYLHTERKRRAKYGFQNSLIRPCSP